MVATKIAVVALSMAVIVMGSWGMTKTDPAIVTGTVGVIDQLKVITTCLHY
jgi:hypothetical protein